MSITVTGEIDLVTTEFLKGEFSQALDPTPTSVVVDLNAVDFCDTTGLSVLVGLNNRCVADHIALRVLPSARIHRLLLRTGLSNLLPIR
ncbi:STAS domain-containing protein [Amycolatopsis roodepoortensis]|uniref:STAS domain-containing protein n=1 Tax=Amycolatopsis roodepoortensis TaxID=700274 RepID=UPI00214AFCB2|nr:STAS domain-containing protein [Amycolatopsis roodepoortensis]UUV36341.1 STAS domain-containing protein [Amycolatopsis roodepoortensis]